MMKNFTYMFALLVVGFSAMAAPRTSAAVTPFTYGEPFIFVERNVEFAVYPDGQFDFLYHPRGIRPSRINPRLNMSYNSGYNYDPYIQYDDFGAVIQVQSVPIYYDYYGRIIQAGSVQISYNNFGRISRIGNLFVHYNPYNQYTHYSGYINGHNHRYIPQPWHHYYRPPHLQYSVVYDQPYRAYYYPSRVKYSYYKNYYNQHYSNGFKRSYYRPGDNIVVYHRGTRSENERDIRNSGSDLSSGYTGSGVRSNQNSERDRTSRSRVSERSSTASPTGNVRDVNTNIRDSRTIRSRTIDRPTAGRVEKTTTPVRTKRVEHAPAERTIRRDSRSSSRQVQRVQQPSVKRAEPVIRSSETTTKERTSTSRSSRGRGQVHN